MGASKNEDFFVRARKHRAQNRSLHVVNEDSSTELTQLSRKKTIFRGALMLTRLLPVIFKGQGQPVIGCLLSVVQVVIEQYLDAAFDGDVTVGPENAR